MGLSGLTPAVDVYAFAMTCMEILSMGRVPWAYVGDDTVRHFVLSRSAIYLYDQANVPHLEENSRPLIPITPYTKPGNPPVLQELLRNCWHRESKLRPDFVTIVKDVKMMRLNEGVPEDVISPKIPEWTLPSSEDFDDRVPSSPDLRPTSFLSGAQRMLRVYFLVIPIIDFPLQPISSTLTQCRNPCRSMGEWSGPRLYHLPSRLGHLRYG